MHVNNFTYFKISNFLIKNHSFELELLNLDYNTETIEWIPASFPYEDSLDFWYFYIDDVTLNNKSIDNQSQLYCFQSDLLGWGFDTTQKVFDSVAEHLV